MRLILLLLTMFCFSSTLFAQDSTSTADAILNFPGKFLSRLNKKTSDLDKQLEKHTEKLLQRLLKKEEKLKKKLYKLDSNATKNLFLLGTDQQYASYKIKMRSDSVFDTNLTGNYMSYTDTMNSVLLYLKQNPHSIKSSGILPEDEKNTLLKLQQLEGRMKDADQLKQYISQRKNQIKQYLLQFTKLPTGITNIYKEYNSELYYYNARLSEYKEALNNPDKLMQKALLLIETIPAFQTFLKSNSFLSSLFPVQNYYGTTQAIAGLQTRDQLLQAIQSQLGGGSISQQAFSTNIANAQSQLDQLKNKLLNYGQSGSEIDNPNFKPNAQKTKSFLKRLEYGTNIQSVKSDYFFPTTTDLAVTVGYKLNTKNVIGIGASFKMGWGTDIRHISITAQGAGLRSFADFNLKGSLYVSGGFEYNYQQPFTSLHPLINLENWQQSGLIGISKIVSLKTKYIKKTKIQLLWDFLSYQQLPKSQPFKFRVGYNF